MNFSGSTWRHLKPDQETPTKMPHKIQKTAKKEIPLIKSKKKGSYQK